MPLKSLLEKIENAQMLLMYTQPIKVDLVV